MKRAAPRPSRAARKALLARLEETTAVIGRYFEERDPLVQRALHAQVHQRLLEDVAELERAGYTRIAAFVGAIRQRSSPGADSEFASLTGDSDQWQELIERLAIARTRIPRSDDPLPRPPRRPAVAMGVPREPLLTRAIPRSIGRRIEREV